MGLLDKAKALVRKHEDKVDDGIEKAGDLIDDKTKGKHTEKIDEVVDKAQDFTQGDEERPR
jgi:hypothetical protein